MWRIFCKKVENGFEMLQIARHGRTKNLVGSCDYVFSRTQTDHTIVAESGRIESAWNESTPLFTFRHVFPFLLPIAEFIRRCQMSKSGVNGCQHWGAWTLVYAADRDGSPTVHAIARHNTVRHRVWQGLCGCYWSWRAKLSVQNWCVEHFDKLMCRVWKVKWNTMCMCAEQLWI